MDRRRRLAAYVIPVIVLAIAAFAIATAFAVYRFALASAGTVLISSLPWLASVIVASAVVGFFLGTSLTRRRILKSMLEKRDIQVLAKRRAASGAISKRREIINYVFGDAADAFFANRSEIRHFMSRDFERVTPDTSLKRIAGLMAEKQVERVYVCDESFHLVGVVAKEDLHQRTGTKAIDVMTMNPVRVSPEHSLQDTASLMLSNNISCLPVCMDELLVGQVTTMDLIVCMECAFDVLQGLAAELREDTALLRV